MKGSFSGPDSPTRRRETHEAEQKQRHHSRLRHGNQPQCGLIEQLHRHIHRAAVLEEAAKREAIEFKIPSENVEHGFVMPDERAVEQAAADVEDRRVEVAVPLRWYLNFDGSGRGAFERVRGWLGCLPPCRRR